MKVNLIHNMNNQYFQATTYKNILQIFLKKLSKQVKNIMTMNKI